jgi:hypothetical protein
LAAEAADRRKVRPYAATSFLTQRADMYTDDELQNIRFEISRALEAINRRIDRYLEKDKLQDIYEDIEPQRSRLSEIVWKIPHDSVWNQSYTTAYNAVDEGAQWISYAMGASDDDRPGYLDTTEGHLRRAVEALVMS